MLLGEPVLLARTPDGRAFALRDICPHRAAPLSAGKFRDGDVECPYHGWRFKPDGVCSLIPSILQDQNLDASRIRVRSYPLREQDGLLWFCERCNHKLYEEFFHLHDIETDFPPVFERFYASPARRTCAQCAHVNPAPSKYVMPDT